MLRKHRRAALESAEGVADKPTKRRESALLAGAIRGATWLGSEGKAFPYFTFSGLMKLYGGKMKIKEFNSGVWEQF